MPLLYWTSEYLARRAHPIGVRHDGRQIPGSNLIAVREQVSQAPRT